MSTPLMRIPWEDIQLASTPIGSGAYADVYSGRWLSADLPVAVKVLRVPRLQGASLATFFAEAERIVQLPHHPAMMKLFGVSVEVSQSRYSLVMEYCENGSLYNFLRQYCTPPSVMPSIQVQLELARQCVQSIAHLHSLPPPLGPVLHLDIKSPNFLLDAHNQIKCADFGLSKTRIETQRLSASKQSFSGSISWMAPELLGGFGKPTQACDVYALAIVLWEIFTGEVPYEDMDNNRIVMLIQQGLRLPVPESIPLSVRNVITSAWHQDPAKRPSAAHMLQSLKDAQQSLSSLEDPSAGCHPLVSPETNKAQVYSWENGKQRMTSENPESDREETEKLTAYASEVSCAQVPQTVTYATPDAKTPDGRAVEIANAFSCVTVEPLSSWKPQHSSGELTPQETRVQTTAPSGIVNNRLIPSPGDNGTRAQASMNSNSVGKPVLPVRLHSSPTPSQKLDTIQRCVISPVHTYTVPLGSPMRTQSWSQNTPQASSFLRSAGSNTAPGGPTISTAIHSAQPPLLYRTQSHGTLQPASLTLQQIHLNASPQPRDYPPPTSYGHSYTPYSDRTSLIKIQEAPDTPPHQRVHCYDKSSGLAVSGTLQVSAAQQAAFDMRSNAALVKARSDVALNGKEAEVRLLQAQRSKEALFLDPVKKIQLQLQFERNHRLEIKQKISKRRWKCCLGYLLCCPIYYCFCANGQFRARSRLKQEKRECEARVRELEKALVLAKHVQDPANQQQLQTDSFFTRNCD